MNFGSIDPMQREEGKEIHSKLYCIGGMGGKYCGIF